MSDLISRADAIDAVAEMMLTEALADYPLVTSADKPDYIKLAAELFEDVPSADRPRWIPCSERLPEERKSYWVCTDNGEQFACRWTDANPFWEGDSTTWHWNIYDIPPHSEVIAWMELPKPYGGDEEWKIWKSTDLRFRTT